MQLLPVLLWPKPMARPSKQHHGNKNIHRQYAIRTFSTPVAAATITTTFIYSFVINALLLITTAWGLTTAQQQSGYYDGASTNADMVTALTGLSNGYAASNYMKNYYQLSEAEASKQQQYQQQQQHQHQHQHDAVDLEAGAGIIGRGFVGLQSNNYGNSPNTRGGGGGGAAAVGVAGGEDAFNVYDGGFVPTSFTAAGQHYGSSLVGLQTATDKINALHQYATTAANKNNLHANQQPYGNVNSNSNSNNNNNNDIAAEVDNNKAQHSLFRRLSNYGDLRNVASDATAGGASVANVADADEANGSVVAAVDTGEVMQNYALTYTDDAQQSSLLQSFYNQQTPFNGGQSVQEQTLANYFPQSMAATAGYAIENQPKYYTLNNYQQVEKPQLQYEQEQYVQYGQEKQQPYEEQQQQQQEQQLQQAYNNLEILTNTQAPATYFQAYIQQKHDNKENRQQQQQQQQHVVADNFHKWKQNQIAANYQPKQSTIDKHYQPHQQHQQHQQQTHANNQYQQQQQQQHHPLHEPETAETSFNARFKKSPKHKSKRHDNNPEVNELNYSYDTLLEQNHNAIDQGSNDPSNVQFQQLEKLQEQLLQQQQQFIELQHQLIDHDQQLQIQKHIANTPAATLPPITHTVHHNPHSLQALAGAPLAKHTQIIKNIPIPQVRQVHIPYRENVTIEIPDPIITPIRRPFAIQIPVTKTVAVPKIQEVKIPIEKVKPFPVERPIPYIVERRVPYPVEKQIAQPVYYPVPIKVPILHTVIHKIHNKAAGPQQQNQAGYHVPHTFYQRGHGHGHGHGRGHGHGHSHYY